MWISTVNPMDCDYFPSLNGTNPCFYERVTCELPKAPKTIFHEERNVYFAGSSVKYSGCVYTGKITKAGESREYFDGTATCLYSGKWLGMRESTCDPKDKESLVFVILGLFLFFVLVGVIACMVCYFFKLRGKIKQ